MRTLEPRIKRWVAIVAAVPFAAISTLAQAGEPNPNATTLPNGANLDVEITAPSDTEEFKVPAAEGPGGEIEVQIDATASVGEGVPNIHLTFVVDVSNSTDFTPCGIADLRIVDCEKLAVLNVIRDPSFESILDTGVTIFGSQGFTGDMNADSGSQPLTTDRDDARTVVNSIDAACNTAFDGCVLQFTAGFVGGGTDFTTGLVAANGSVGASSAGTKRVFFLSDGLGGGNPQAFDDAVRALMAQIDSFAIGANSRCGNPNVPSLQRMADLSGGVCTEVPDPADLPGLLPDLIATSLDDVQIAVDGSDVATACVPGLPADGPVSADCSASPSLGVGDYGIEATAEGSDSSGSASVTANSVGISLLQLAARPDSATNECGSGNTHTVFARILGGTGPDRNIDFEVAGDAGNSASGSETATPGGDPVSFTYAQNDPGNLGDDTITVSTTIGGMEDSLTLSKTWGDTTAPEVTAELVRVGNGDDDDDDDEGLFRVEFSASDDCDDDLDVTAVLVVPDAHPIEVENGQLVEFEFDDETEIEFEDGILEIEAKSLTLVVTATDESGNETTAEAHPEGLSPDNDDDDDKVASADDDDD